MLSMLAEFAIENLGVIPQAAIEPAAGLTVLTGETGAGKTMLVTGLRLLVGGRADASRVRTGSKQAAVEGRFDLSQVEADVAAAVRAVVDAAGGKEDENGEFIATRIVNASGRSKAHLGGRAVPASALGEFSSELLTIHGQNDQLRLLAPERQLAALDRMDAKIVRLLADYQKDYARWRQLDRDLASRMKSRRELAQEVDRLEFAIREITAIDPQPSEDEQLQELIRRLQDVDDLREQTVQAIAAIDGTGSLMEYGSGAEDTDGAASLLGQAVAALRGSSDSALLDMVPRLEAVISELSEISGELGGFLSDLPADPQELERALTRQQELKSLTRKYAPNIDGVLTWLGKAEARLGSIDISPEALEQLRKDVAVAEQKMLTSATALSTARKKAAGSLAQQVTTELHGLAMPKSLFSVHLAAIAPTASGTDAVEFQLAPNAHEVAKPLASSASGGELSRVMLALEVILSGSSKGSTLVFDEVDAGVGGRAAVEIGRRLAKLAVHNQVIVVTHLPQVAAFADAHVHVSKDVGELTVTSGVALLTEEERIDELARMLAGLDDTDTGRAHAAELLHKAQSEVQLLRR